MISASESLPLSLGQLARLVGALAFPNPEGDDTIVHGPGGPRVRGGSAIEIRNGAIAVIRWALTIAEQAAVIDLVNHGEHVMSQTAPRTSEPPPPPSKDPGKGGGSQDGAVPKEPPNTVMRLIEPQVDAFACSLSDADAVRLPLPAACGADPWRIPITSERERLLGLLYAGAQFELAADSSPFERLRDLFRRTARNLFRHGLHHPAIAVV